MAAVSGTRYEAARLNWRQAVIDQDFTNEVATHLDTPVFHRHYQPTCAIPARMQAKKVLDLRAVMGFLHLSGLRFDPDAGPPS